MKPIARSYFWWSGLDKAVEDLSKSCSACQALQAAPAAAPLHPWIWPDAPDTTFTSRTVLAFRSRTVPGTVLERVYITNSVTVPVCARGWS